MCYRAVKVRVPYGTYLLYPCPEAEISQYMYREGAIDPRTGQRAAFPLATESQSAEDKKVIEYLNKVRDEALHLEYQQIRKRPHPETKLDYGEAFATKHEAFQAKLALQLDPKVTEITSKLFNGKYTPPSQPEIPQPGAPQADAPQAEADLLALYTTAHSAFSSLDSTHPEECTSLATWKDWMAHNWPVPVNHSDTFRLYKYLIKWVSGTPPPLHFIWAWSLLLRTPDLLDGAEISVLRDLCRALKTHTTANALASAFIQIVAVVFKQRDMLDL